MSRIGYRRHTACLGLVVLLALSSCGKKAEDTAAGGSPGASSAPTTAASPPEAATSPTTAASSPGAATSGSTTASSPGASSSASAGGVKPNGTVCPASAPVKGNISKKRGKIYFTTKFPDYKNVKPETCFADVAAAKSAGFRSPKAAK